MLTQLISLLGLAPTQDAKPGRDGATSTDDFSDVFSDLEQDTGEDVADLDVPITDDPDMVAASEQAETPEAEAELEEWLASLRKARAHADEADLGPHRAQSGRSTDGASALDDIAQAQVPSHPAAAIGMAAPGAEIGGNLRRSLPQFSPLGAGKSLNHNNNLSGAGHPARELPVFNISELGPLKTRPQKQVLESPVPVSGNSATDGVLDDTHPEVKPFPRSHIEGAPASGPLSGTRPGVRFNAIRIAPEELRANNVSARGGGAGEGQLASLAEMLEVEQGAASGSPRRPADSLGALAEEMGATIRITRGTPTPEAAAQIGGGLSGARGADPFAQSATERGPDGGATGPLTGPSGEFAGVPVFRSPRAAQAKAAGSPDALRADKAPRARQLASDAPEPLSTVTRLPTRAPDQMTNTLMAPPAAVQTAASIMTRLGMDTRSEDDALEVGDLSAPGSASLQRGHGAATASPYPTPGRPDSAHVARQIADALPRLSDGTIDIRLDPEELGRVRLQMVSGETGMTVHVTADRPETLDLMRRHIDQLARDLAEAGYEGASFDFGDGQGDGHDSPARQQSTPLSTAEDIPHKQPAMTAAQDGLDILI